MHLAESQAIGSSIGSTPNFDPYRNLQMTAKVQFTDELSLRHRDNALVHDVVLPLGRILVQVKNYKSGTTSLPIM